MSDKRDLKIVISAEDNFTSTFSNLRKASFQANLGMEALKMGLHAIGSAVNIAVGALRRIGTGLFEVGKTAITLSGNLEQNRIAFETMLGSADEARTLLEDISDFARKTPFDLPGVVQAGQQLLAMGSSADTVLGELKMLGDVSAGLNVPLDRLILNFGQVRTQGKLTGRELRDFNVAGVPLIDTLVNLGNEGKLTAGAFETVGGTSSATKSKIENLDFSLSKSNRRLEEMKEKGKEGTASFKNLEATISRNKDKLNALGTVTSGYSQKIVYTKEKIAEMVSDGLIKFEDVSKAFELMTGEGGKFFDLMDKQSRSFQGIVENMKDGIGRLLRSMAGITEAGDILEGGFFSKVKEAGDGLRIVVDSVSTAFEVLRVGHIGPLVELIPQIGSVIGPTVGTMEGLREMVGKTGDKTFDLSVRMTDLINNAKVNLQPSLADLKESFFEFAEEIFGVDIRNQDLASAITTLAVPAIEKILFWSKEFIDWIVENKDTIIDMADAIVKVADAAFSAAKGIVEFINAVDRGNKIENDMLPSWMPAANRQHGGFIDAPYGQAVPAVLHGGERVISRNGMDVNGGGGGGGISLSLNFSGPVSMDSKDRVDELANQVVRILGRQYELASKGVSI